MWIVYVCFICYVLSVQLMSPQVLECISSESGFSEFNDFAISGGKPKSMFHFWESLWLFYIPWTLYLLSPSTCQCDCNSPVFTETMRALVRPELRFAIYFLINSSIWYSQPLMDYQYSVILPIYRWGNQDFNRWNNLSTVRNKWGK